MGTAQISPIVDYHESMDPNPRFVEDGGIVWKDLELGRAGDMHLVSHRTILGGYLGVWAMEASNVYRAFVVNLFIFSSSSLLINKYRIVSEKTVKGRVWAVV